MRKSPSNKKGERNAELAALYLAGNMPIADLMARYHISKARLYQILERQGVTERKRVVRSEQRERAALEFVGKFIQENHYPPTISEIGAGIGVHPTRVRPLLERAAQKNLIHYTPGKARAIALVEA